MGFTIAVQSRKRAISGALRTKRLSTSGNQQVKACCKIIFHKNILLFQSKPVSPNCTDWKKVGIYLFIGTRKIPSIFEWYCDAIKNTFEGVSFIFEDIRVLFWEYFREGYRNVHRYWRQSYFHSWKSRKSSRKRWAGLWIMSPDFFWVNFEKFRTLMMIPLPYLCLETSHTRLWDLFLVKIDHIIELVKYLAGSLGERLDTGA